MDNWTEKNKRPFFIIGKRKGNIRMSTAIKFFLCSTFLFLFSIGYPSDNNVISNDVYKYITGEDGIIRFRVNVIGHVNSPGSYLVYDGCDLVTALSYAGGPRDGSKLDKVTIYSQEGKSQVINLSDILDDDDPSNNIIKLKPHDTVYIEQSRFSYYVENTRFLNTILQFINLYFNVTE